MTYHINPELRKIVSPVRVCISSSEEVLEFNSGAELVDHSFEKPYMVGSIRAMGGTVEIELLEKTRVNTSWIGEEQVSFF